MSHSVVAEIIDVVGEAEGADPLDLDYRIGEHIDTMAIETLVEHDNASFTLTFELPNHEVTVTEDGIVSVSISSE